MPHNYTASKIIVTKTHLLNIIKDKQNLEMV